MTCTTDGALMLSNFSFLMQELPGDEMDINSTLGPQLAGVPDETLLPSADELETIAIYKKARHFLQIIVIPIVLCVGLMGNIVNLAVFSRKRLLHGMDEIERSATAGLVALALSDLLFCFTGLFEVLLMSAVRLEVSWINLMVLYYRSLQPGLSSLFIFLSTWLTVFISLERYFAISHPFHARWFIRVRRTVLAHSSVLLVSVAINLPLFLRTMVVKSPGCPPGCSCYMLMPRDILNTVQFERGYSIFHCTVAIVIPVIVLALSNFRLVVEIYRSRKRGIADSNRYSASKITVTLATIVVLFFCLMVPSMLTKFVDMYQPIPPYNRKAVEARRLALCVTNLTQAINFAINFLLYCAICKHFRETLGGSLCRRSSSTSSSSRTTVNTTTSQHRYHLVNMHI